MCDVYGEVSFRQKYVQMSETGRRDVVAYEQNIYIVVSGFELQSRYYVHFWTNTLEKGMKPLILSIYGLNNTTSVLLKGWLWN